MYSYSIFSLFVSLHNKMSLMMLKSIISSIMYKPLKALILFPLLRIIVWTESEDIAKSQNSPELVIELFSSKSSHTFWQLRFVMVWFRYNLLITNIYDKGSWLYCKQRWGSFHYACLVLLPRWYQMRGTNIWGRPVSLRCASYV